MFTSFLRTKSTSDGTRSHGVSDQILSDGPVCSIQAVCVSRREGGSVGTGRQLGTGNPAGSGGSRPVYPSGSKSTPRRMRTIHPFFSRKRGPVEYLKRPPTPEETLDTPSTTEDLGRDLPEEGDPERAETQGSDR